MLRIRNTTILEGDGARQRIKYSADSQSPVLLQIVQIEFESSSTRRCDGGSLVSEKDSGKKHRQTIL